MIAKFARDLIDYSVLLWILCQENDLTEAFLTRKYKEFSPPAEIFASRAFICKFRKNLDLAHITRCTVDQ